MIVNVQLVDMNIDGYAVNGSQMQSMLVLIVEQVEATR